MAYSCEATERYSGKTPGELQVERRSNPGELRRNQRRLPSEVRLGLDDALAATVYYGHLEQRTTYMVGEQVYTVCLHL
jgi:hypothetical protein